MTKSIFITGASRGLGRIWQEVRTQLETSVYGLRWLTQAIIPVMREQKNGHIIQLSSALGVVAFPTTGLYRASKFAVEAISESLAAEVGGFGSKVSILEPNGFKTEFATTSAIESKPLAVYDEVRAALAAGNNPDDWGCLKQRRKPFSYWLIR